MIMSIAKTKNTHHQLTFATLDHISISIIIHKDFENQFPITHKTIPIILSEAGATRERIEEWVNKRNIRTKIYAQVAEHEAIVSMVGLGLGVSLSPDIVIENSPLKDQITKQKRKAKRVRVMHMRERKPSDRSIDSSCIQAC